MDTKWEVLRSLVVKWMDAEEEERVRILRQVRSEIDAVCTRFLQGKDIELSKDWKKALAGQDPASRKLAQVLQTLHKDPSVFGMIGIDVANDVWMKRLLDRLGKTRLLRPFIPFSEADRQAEYFLITWLICVERKDAFLQQAVQRAAKLLPSKQTETGLWENRWDAFDYLAAASLLLLHNTQPIWHDAVRNYRKTIGDLFPEKHLPPPSQWKTGTKNGTQDVLSDEEWIQAFQTLQNKDRLLGPETLPDLSDLLEENFASGKQGREKEDVEFLRQFGGLPSSYQNDYVYMLKNYLARVGKITKREIGMEHVSIQALADMLRSWALDEQKPVVGMEAKKRRNVAERKDDVAFSRLFLPPEWALKREYLSTEGEAEQETAQKGREKPKDEEQQKEAKGQKKKQATRKAPFRALRYTVFLLMGMQEDRYYGEAEDMRLFLLRLGLACGLSSDGLQQLLLEQELPGIDFKTAPELILAYEANRSASQDAAKREGVPKIRTIAYAEAALLLRVYRLLTKTQPDPAGPRVQLESTRYIYQQYCENVHLQGENISPRDFLAWMRAQNLPGYPVEKLLSGQHSSGNVVFCCMQLFHTLWFLNHINEACIQLIAQRERKGNRRSWESPSPAQKQREMEWEASRKRSEETRRQVETLLQQLNAGGSVFENEKTAACLQKLLNTLPDLQEKRKNRRLPLHFFFPDRDVQKLLFSIFPYDKEKEWLLLEREGLSDLPFYDLRKYGLQQLCRCVAERKLLQRDDFFCLMFADYLLTHHLEAEDGKSREETYVTLFEQVQGETAKESRMLPFCAEREPQMASAFRRAVNDYMQYLSVL